jgi:hypothetical protein
MFASSDRTPTAGGNGPLTWAHDGQPDLSGSGHTELPGGGSAIT